MADLVITMTTTPEQGEELLNLLADDDGFRAALVADPAGVLANYGIEITPTEAIPPDTELATKNEFQDLRDKMRKGDDIFGRVYPGVWRYQLLGHILSMPALPLVETRRRAAA
jgi:putative modified peptide